MPGPNPPEGKFDLADMTDEQYAKWWAEGDAAAFEPMSIVGLENMQKLSERLATMDGGDRVPVWDTYLQAVSTGEMEWKWLAEPERAEDVDAALLQLSAMKLPRIAGFRQAIHSLRKTKARLRKAADDKESARSAEIQHEDNRKRSEEEIEKRFRPDRERLGGEIERFVAYVDAMRDSPGQAAKVWKNLAALLDMNCLAYGYGGQHPDLIAALQGMEGARLGSLAKQIRGELQARESSRRPGVLCGIDIGVERDRATYQLLHCKMPKSEEEEPRPFNSLSNVESVLGRHPNLSRAIRLNDFENAIYFGDTLLEDWIEVRLAIWLDRVYGLSNVGSKVVHEAAISVARANKWDPVRDYFRSLPTWDGVNRTEHWLNLVYGVDDTPLNRAYASRFLIGAVARILQPGCKCDTMLVLYGQQGAGKSTGFEVLAGDWFSDTPLDFSNPGSADNCMALENSWIHEVPELDGRLRGVMAARVKEFLSIRDASYRPPYGRNRVPRERHTIIVGSTNKPDFLKDPTGERRFWPVTVRWERARLDWLRANRDQLWAEALHRQAILLEKWHLDEDEFVEGQKRSAKGYREEHPALPIVAHWVIGKNDFHAHQVITYLNGLDNVAPMALNRQSEMAIAGMLKQLGLDRHRVTRSGRKVSVWRHPESADPEPAADPDENIPF